MASATTLYAGVRGSGLFVSTDAGATFSTNLLANPGGPSGTFDYIAFSQSAWPDTNMFASIADEPSLRLIKVSSSRQTAALLGQ